MAYPSRTCQLGLSTSWTLIGVRTRHASCIFRWATRLLVPLPVLFLLLVLLALGREALALVGRPRWVWTRPLVLGVSSAALALLIAVVLKWLIGRSDPYPTYLVAGSYGFHPLHGGVFPSATTAATSGFVAVIWLVVPRLRVLGAIVLSLIVAAIVLTNGHWVADIIGGGFLGAFVGWYLSSRRSTPRRLT